MDPEVKLIDGVHDILRNVTLQVLVTNNFNQQVNFPKGNEDRIFRATN